jgi:regulator of replication initiation timing
VLAIAEKLEEHADESNERLRMANETTTDNVDVDVQQTVADDAVNTLREDISSAMNLLGTIYEGFYSMLDETYELEQNLATNDMGAVAEQFTKLVAGIQKRFESLRDKASTAETELTQLKDRIDAEKSAKEFAEKKTRRLQALSEVGIEPSEDRQAFYLDMSEDIFTAYVDDLKSVRSRFSSSEHKEIIPDPVVSNSTATITTQELAKIILQK